MQKVQATNEGNIVVTVARFGQSPQNVEVPEGSTVSQVLSLAGIQTEGREEMFVEGVTAEANDILENGDILSVVTPKQAG